MHYELYLPFPPTVNNYYVKTQRGVFISQKGRKYREAVAEAYMQQLPDVMITDKMFIEVVLWMPDNRKRDLDNCKKALFDALSPHEKDGYPGIWEDDSLIDQDFTYRGEVMKGGQVLVIISDAGPLLKVGQSPPD